MEILLGTGIIALCAIGVFIGIAILKTGTGTQEAVGVATREIIIAASEGRIAVVAAKDAAINAQEKLSDVLLVNKEIHHLVNSNYGIQLKINMVLAEKVAKLPEATEEDKKVARLAKEAYEEHEKKQSEIDNSVNAEKTRKVMQNNF